MSPRYIMGLIFLWVTLTTLSLLLEGDFFGTAEQSTLNVLIGFQIIEVKSFGFLRLPLPNFSYFTAVFNAVTWNYTMYGGNWGQFFKFIILYPVTGGIVFGLYSFFLSATFGLLRR